MAEEGLTAELLAKKFANGGSMERYMGKWLLLSMESQDTDRDAEDQFAELRQIPVIRSLFGSEKINMAEILKSWYPVGRNSVNKRLQSEQGLRVGEVVVFKASRPECLGRKSKYIAFGTRPLVSVKLMYPIATDFSSTPLTSCSSSSATSGSSSSSPPPAPSASTSTTAASNCSKMQKLGAEPPPPENQKRTSRPSLSSSTYLMFNDDVDDEAAEAAIAECTGAVGGKRRMTRSTAETKIDGEVAWERARDKETGQFYSWEDHASELQSQVHGLVKLLEATGLKLGEARAELSISDKHLHCLVSSPVLRGTQRGAEPPAPTPPPSPPTHLSCRVHAVLRGRARVHGASSGEPSPPRPPRPPPHPPLAPATVAPSPTHPSPTPTAVNTAPNPQPGVHDACSEATRAELGCNSNVYGSRAVCGEMVDAPVLGGACVGVKRWG
jgi:hypothetical protein